MKRKEFIKAGAIACLAQTSIMALLQGCTGSKMLLANLEGDRLLIPLKEFEIKKGDNKTYRSYVVVYNELLKYPFCVYRHHANDYSALQMRCTHQGTELSVYGDKLHCSAHGSEFDNRGQVQNGPAENPLKSFPVEIQEQQIIISLKSQP